MKKLEQLDKYVLLPNVGFYGGFIYDGEDIFLTDDHDIDEDYDFVVKQEIKNNILITDLTKEYKYGEHTIKETSHLEINVNVGDLLVYVEGIGFTLPEKRLCKIAEAKAQYDILEGNNNNDDTK